MRIDADGCRGAWLRTWRSVEDEIDAATLRTTEYTIRRTCPDASKHPHVNVKPLTTFRSDADTTEQLMPAKV